MSASADVDDGPDVVAEFCDLGGYTPSGVIFVSFDIETIGPCMTKHAMVELGAVALAVEDVHKRRVLARFEGRLKIPEGCGFEERCEKEFWDVHKPQEKKVVLACQKEPEDTMRAFVEWVDQVRISLASGEPRNVRFVTDAAYFDAGWVSHYLTKYANHEPLHTFFTTPDKSRFKPVLDTNAFFRGVAGVDLNGELEVEQGPTGWFSADKAVRAALNIPDDEKPEVKHDHRAVNDATSIGQKYLIVLKYLKLREAVAKGALDPEAAQQLINALNYTPHKITFMAEDKETVVWEIPPSGNEPLRLEGQQERQEVGADVGSGRIIPCLLGAPKYTRLNRPPPECPVVVSALVANYLVEKGFRYPIFTPDSNGRSVRKDGMMVGTTAAVMHSSGVVQ